MATTGSALRDRIQVLRLDHKKDTDTYAWKASRWIWAAAEQDAGRNLFSSVGVGARGVTFTIRRSPRLTLHNAFFWRGRHCFLTSIVDGDPGFQVVKAALCESVSCSAVHRKDTLGPGNRPQTEEGPPVFFPGILTEKYAGYAQEETYAKEEILYVLVVPKPVTLAAGALVSVLEGPAAQVYNVRACHVLDPYKNEYEIFRRTDV